MYRGGHGHILARVNFPAMLCCWSLPADGPFGTRAAVTLPCPHRPGPGSHLQHWGLCLIKGSVKSTCLWDRSYQSCVKEKRSLDLGDALKRSDGKRWCLLCLWCSGRSLCPPNEEHTCFNTCCGAADPLPLLSFRKSIPGQRK